MAGSILTPVSIWSDFYIEDGVGAEIIEEFKRGGVIITRFYLNGRSVQDGRVRIYAVAARSVELSLLPCVYVLPDLENDIDEELLVSLAKAGYYAVSTDLSGKKDGKEFFTEYPYSVNYAKYENSKYNLKDVEDDAKKTAWYEWDCVGKYTLDYLASRPFITGIGGVGVKNGSTVLWHIAANEKKLSCAAFLFGAGWDAYYNRNLYKFGGEIPEFSENELKYLAGVDAQAYAAYIKCHSLVLAATNSKRFDSDRAFDTLSRIDKSVYSGIDYSVNRSEVLDKEAYENLFLFLDRTLLKGQGLGGDLPSPPDIECDIQGGSFTIEVTAGTEGLKKVSLYAAEGALDPSVRAWALADEIEEDEMSDGQFSFGYEPYFESGIATFFVKAEYQNGFTVSSAITGKKFTAEEVKKNHKSNVVFSDRKRGGESVFAPAREGTNLSSIENKDEVFIKKGPMDIKGITSEAGLITYKIYAEKDKPYDGAMFMVDVYTKEAATVYLTLCANTGEEYVAAVNCAGGKAWHNFKIEQSKFKSKEGMQLKSYKSVYALKISSDAEYLINNLLWV